MTLRLAELVIAKSIVSQFTAAADSGSHVLLYGPPGSGKTTLARAYAYSKGASLYETNASDARRKSDFEALRLFCRSKTFKRVIILLDEIDERSIKNESSVMKLLEESKIQIFMTCNKEWEIPSQIKSICSLIEVPAPKKRDVIDLAVATKSMGKTEVSMDVIPRDFRGVLALKYNGDAGELDDSRSYAERVFKGEHNLYNRSLNFWILDNATDVYTGLDLFTALNVLSQATISPCSINALPVAENFRFITFPRYFRRLKEHSREARRNGT